MKKKDLEVGMVVKNTISGNVGKIHDLKAYILPFVVVRRKFTSGKNKDKYDYPAWQVNNLEKV